MTNDEMIVRILLNACHILEKRGWTQRAMARDARGDACNIRSDAAISYCLSGALVKSWRELDHVNENFYFELFESGFSEVILTKYNYRCTLTRWNDDIATHREAVVELIYAVIKSIQSGSSQSIRATAGGNARRSVNGWFGSRFLTREQGKVKQADLRDISTSLSSMMHAPRVAQRERLSSRCRRRFRLGAPPALNAATSRLDGASGLCLESFLPRPARDAFRPACIC